MARRTIGLLVVGLSACAPETTAELALALAQHTALATTETTTLKLFNCDVSLGASIALDGDVAVVGGTPAPSTPPIVGTSLQPKSK